MTKNVGSTDRFLRVLLGIGLLLIAFEGPRTAWGYVGLLPLASGLLGYCPLYHLFGRKSLGTAP